MLFIEIASFDSVSLDLNLIDFLEPAEGLKTKVMEIPGQAVLSARNRFPGACFGFNGVHRKFLPEFRVLR
jgi:hypothetical protein